jgi:hypothetical protein
MCVTYDGALHAVVIARLLRFVIVFARHFSRMVVTRIYAFSCCTIRRLFAWTCLSTKTSHPVGDVAHLLCLSCCSLRRLLLGRVFL